MKRAIVPLLCLVLATSCTIPADDNGDQTLSFLWEVSSETNTVYILGSVHVAKADIYPLAEVIEDTYETADYLVVEINTNAISDLGMAALLMDKGMYSTGESLRDNISENLYSRLRNRLEGLDSSGLLLLTMNTFEPWVVAITIADMDYIELGYEAKYGIDYHFLERAEADSKDILELETVEFQLDIFDSMSYEMQIAMLEDAIDNPVTEDDFEEMLMAWGTGDIATMEQLVFEGVEEDADYAEFLSIVNDDRNFLMVEKIEQYLRDDETYFVVVGAAHIIGENGIINLLANEGYTVEQQ